MAVPEGVCNLVVGEREIGERLAADGRVPLVSATGSTAWGRQLVPLLVPAFGRSLLEIGGNNAIIVSKDAIWKWP
jgi:aldehyde dehydrogenase (NAD+)